MLSYQTIAPHTLELQRQLTALPKLKKTRLVGGTALALQFGHRSSVDLDLFGYLDEDISALRDSVEEIGSVKVLKETRNIRIYDVDGVMVDFVDHSRYPWLCKPIVEDGLRLASVEDIAAMKVNAIEGYGTCKDFVDIYVLLQRLSSGQRLRAFAVTLGSVIHYCKAVK